LDVETAAAYSGRLVGKVDIHQMNQVNCVMMTAAQNIVAGITINMHFCNCQLKAAANTAPRFELNRQTSQLPECCIHPKEMNTKIKNRMFCV